MPNYRFVELRCNPDGSYTAIAKTPDRRLVRLEAPPPPCLDPESRAEICDGQIPTCGPYILPSEKQAEEGIVACGCKSYDKCVNAWVEVEVLRKPAKTKQGENALVLEFGSIEQFIGEAKDAGVAKVYTTFLTEFSKTSGIPAYRIKFIVTAMGRVAAHAGEPEKTLLRYTRDFGPVLEDISSRKMPEGYARKVEQKGQEITEKLIGAGFQVRAGEITALT